MAGDNYDNFSDVVNGTNGVFGGEQAAIKNGLIDHQGVSAQVAPNAVILTFQCQVCGKPTKCHVEYPEMVALKYGVNPAIAFRQAPQLLSETTRWEYLPYEGGWNPKAKCSDCNASLDIVVESHEPERFLSAARRRGYINQAGEHQVSQICAQAAAAGHSVRR